MARLKTDEQKDGVVTSVTSVTSGNSYHLLPQSKSNPLSYEEIKSAYLDIRGSGVVPTVRLLHEKLGHGSFRTINQAYQQLRKEDLSIRLSELEKKRIPTGRLKTLIEDLAECATKYTIEDDEQRIAHYHDLIIAAEENARNNVTGLSARIDELTEENSELKTMVEKLNKENNKINDKNKSLTDQNQLITNELNLLKSKYDLFTGLESILRKPNLLEAVHEKLKEEKKNKLKSR